MARERQRNAFIALGAWAILVLAGTFLPSYKGSSTESEHALPMLRQELETLRAEHAALKSQLGLLGHFPPEQLAGLRPLAARITDTRSLTPRRRFGSLDAGRDQEVRVGQAVISECGAVGTVYEVDATTSRVVFVDDPAFRVAYRIAEGEGAGVAAGGPDRGQLHGVLRNSLEQADAGAVIVTAGGDGVFPRGIVLGRVSEPGGGIYPLRIQAACDPRPQDSVLVLRGASTPAERSP